MYYLPLKEPKSVSWAVLLSMAEVLTFCMSMHCWLCCCDIDSKCFSFIRENMLRFSLPREDSQMVARFQTFCWKRFVNYSGKRCRQSNKFLYLPVFSQSWLQFSFSSTSFFVSSDINLIMWYMLLFSWSLSPELWARIHQKETFISSINFSWALQLKIKVSSSSSALNVKML